ncbi:hypothetical protein [Streptomyces sp. RKAG293]|uniref:hypothetical protein n=1 Tax=Streptomyces sp. RKAG293 TaxID=2893403 RepID=UPI002034249A|nr:hypothetical protein [Streptomyces sp. RKAG293]MCM2420998.1 hypothetical protein [Streptomyces sp. RKAG293]
MSSDRSRTAYADSAADLARSALDALHGAGGTAMVAAHVEGAEDGAAALAAVRVVGADTFAPICSPAPPCTPWTRRPWHGPSPSSRPRRAFPSRRPPGRPSRG